jgi:pimeloyl-ACP methyl ester carboxylesterase
LLQAGDADRFYGHSLGGGLAQLAALANKPSGPRIRKVFAFDPWPVTGAHLVEKELLKANSQGLTIDRIYQEGEVLSYARRLIEEYPPSASRCSPHVRTVKIDAVSSRSVIGLHGVNALAVQMVGLYNDDDTQLAYRTPPLPKGCDLRYRPPATDEDGTVVAGVAARVASVRARRTLYASASKYGLYVDQYNPSYPPEAQQRGLAATKLTGGRIHRVAITSGGHRSRKLLVANTL